MPYSGCEYDFNVYLILSSDIRYNYLNEGITFRTVYYQPKIGNSAICGYINAILY